MSEQESKLYCELGQLRIEMRIRQLKYIKMYNEQEKTREWNRQETANIFSEINELRHDMEVLERELVSKVEAERKADE